jgi:L-asparaginase II
MNEIQQSIEHGYLPLFHTVRGGYVESVHYGAITIVDNSGNLIAWYGNPQTPVFLRSAAKPLQALPLIENNGAIHFQMSGKEIAIICASHSGTDRHLKTLYALQKKIGVSETDLLCCTHQPISAAARALLQDQGIEPNQYHHNCSGKHTGMLALGKMLDLPIKEYTEAEHPIQKRVISTVAEMCDLNEMDIQLGRDGCSVPAFFMPLQNAALGWARLIDPANLPEKRKVACQLISKSMQENPFYVAGPGRFDTRLMSVGKGKYVSKAGAEAFQALGIYPDVIKPGSSGLGIVLKIADGDLGKRAKRAVTIEILRQMKLLSEDQIALLKDLGPTIDLKNHCQLPVGEAKPCFQLQYS